MTTSGNFPNFIHLTYLQELCLVDSQTEEQSKTLGPENLKSKILKPNISSHYKLL